jgi:Cu+-exporting ATPase
MSGAMAQWFRWTSFVLFLPVICFSAVPFYRSAWSSLRSKEVSIDIPVIFGISLGSLVSIVNLFMGDERVYFDSLSTLVFLLLSTRYLLKRTQQNALDSSRLVHFLTPSAVRKWHANRKAFELVGVNQIQPGDRVQILPNECIPIDGLIDQGSSFLDCAILSGEAQPQKVVAGDLVFAGTFNLDAPIEIRVTQSGSKTRVGRILEEMERLCIQKAPITVFADRVSRYFVAAVVILSAFTFAWGFRGDWLGGMNRALAIAIVTCPCTFALITPLAFTMALGKLARKGVLVKGAEVLEKLARVKHVFLDKTGTLTVGTPQVKEWEVPEELSVPILAIESHSVHPVAKALVKYLQPKAPVTLPHIENLQETMGQGIRALIGEDWVEIRRAQNQSSLGTEISVLKNDVWVGRIVLRDQVREDSKESVARLQSLGLKTGILSGDHRVPVTQVAIQVGIDPTNCFSEASPEAKSESIGGHKNTLMVGDGANDALALGRADVGIAVHSGVEISLHAADVYLNSAGVRPVYDLVLIARETLRVVRRNFSFSIIYNLIAGGFALAGKIDPLFAAIIMPMSGLTVFISSVIGTSKMRKAFREINV